MILEHPGDDYVTITGMIFIIDASMETLPF